MPGKQEILSLYKQLLRYGQQLRLTDKTYYHKRIVNEFKKNKSLEDQQEITFNFEILIRQKYTLDYSLFPTIEEKDLEEKFVRGSGPGGSAVNTNSNCVVLTHLPSGTVVKCHLSRDLQENRKLARKILLKRLDDTINGNKSISSQQKAIATQKALNTSKKKEKLNNLKETWKSKYLTDD